MTGQETGDPPKDAYRRVTDAGRYGPLHEIAARLLDELEARYDVARQTFAQDDPHGSEPATSVRLVPHDTAAAALAIVFDSFPGVLVRCGRRDADGVHFPHCGCDACEETLDDCAEELARMVDATIAGTLGERLIQAGGAWWREVWYRTSGSVDSHRTRLTKEQHADLREAMPDGELTWAPWPARQNRSATR